MKLRRDRERRVARAPSRSSTRRGFKTPARESVLVQSTTRRSYEPRFAVAVAHVVADALARSRTSTNIVSPIDHPNAGLISRDRHSALVQFDVKGKAEDAKDKIAPILAAVDGAQAGEPERDHRGVRPGARPTTSSTSASSSDMRRAEFTSLPLTLAILVVAFGALVAAGLPVLLAFSAVLAATGLNALASHVVPTADADAQRDHPHDRHGRRDRLLALLPPPRARGAARRHVAARRAAHAPRARRARRC